MVNYPLSQSEAALVRWTGRLMTFLAVATMLLLGSFAWAS